MKLLSLIFLAPSISIVVGRDNRMYPQGICETEDGVLNCTCTQRENLTIAKILDKTIFAMEVQKCGYVSVLPIAFWSLELHYLAFNDILVLDMKPDSLKGMIGINFIELSNIASLKVTTNSIQTTNTSKVILLNVTAETLKPHVFNIDSVTHFLVTNSSFGRVETAALSFHDPQFIFVINSSIGDFQTEAFRVSGFANQVYFHNTSYQSVRKHAFYFESLEYLTFQACTFHSVESNMSFGRVNHYFFFGNTIVEADTSIFTSLNVTYLFWLNQNRILAASPGALDYRYDLVPNVTTENNTFTCNCGILWFQNPKYDRLRSSSYCDGSTETFSLSRLDYKRMAEDCDDSRTRTFTTVRTVGVDEQAPLPHGSTTSEAGARTIHTITVFTCFLLFRTFMWSCF